MGEVALRCSLNLSPNVLEVYFKGGNTIKNLLMAPKDQDTIQKKSGVIYSYKCDRVNYNEENIGESSRTFGERFKEHLKAPSPYMTILTPLVTMDKRGIIHNGQ